MTTENDDAGAIPGYRRIFTREQIVAHLRESVDIVDALELAADDVLRRDAFSVAQGMVSTVEPIESGVVKAAPRMVPPTSRRH